MVCRSPLPTGVGKLAMVVVRVQGASICIIHRPRPSRSPVTMTKNIHFLTMYNLHILPE